MAQFEKGNTAGKGRPRGSGTPVTRLRKTLTKLNDMEDSALRNIQDSVEGKEVDKEVLATSKWVVTTAVAIARAAAQEENNRFQKKVYEDEKRERAEGTTGNVIRFRTTMVEDED